MSFGKILLSATLAFLSLSTFAQNSTLISGYVKDSTVVISGASVLVKGTKNGTVTNSQGYYELKDLQPGRYTLILSSVGFITESRQVTIKKDQHLSLDFSLKSNANELHNVAITGKTQVRQLKESGFAVNTIETKQYANATTDLNQVLNRSTGIRVRDQGGLGSAFNFSVNGLSGKQVRFFLDGIPMESFGGSMSLNNIPVNLAERIEVYKGVVPVELGADALGGAVNIVTNHDIKNFLDLSYSAGSFNTHRAALNSRFTDAKTGIMVNLNGFFNYSDNNYLMRSNPKYDAKIEVIENGAFVEKDVHRFHDAYRSAMGQAEVGVVNKSWADLFTVGLLYSSQDKEIQTGASQNKVIGAVTNNGNYLMPTLKFKKDNFLIKGLSANLFASYSINKYTVTDTSSNLYGWDGKVIKNNALGELSDIKTIYDYRNEAGLARANFSYKLDEQNAINFNYTLNHFRRSAHEELDPTQRRNAFDEPNKITKNIAGLAWQNKLFGGRLSNTLFGKYYGFNALVRESIIFTGSETGFKKVDSKTNNNYFGYGIASRYQLTADIGIKASYEAAYRLQEGDELFGDGITVIANPQLKPEQSKNLNIGAYFIKHLNNHTISADGSWFYRNAKDFIYSVPSGGVFSAYKNVGMAKINGFEGEIRYDYNHLIAASVNMSYQNSVNNREYLEATPDQKDLTYKDRVPNQPWLYGNAELSIGKNDWLAKDSRIQFSWYTQYVNWFYLNWESIGSKETNNKIPTQFIQNASLSYALHNGKYNIGLDCTNLTNELAYDNFRLQKAGRAFYLKLRYFIK